MHNLTTNKTHIKKQSVKKNKKQTKKTKTKQKKKKQTKKKQKKKRLSSKCYHFVKTYFYGLKLLYANVQCVSIVYAKYHKGLVRVDFPAHALSEY